MAIETAFTAIPAAQGLPIWMTQERRQSPTPIFSF